MNTELFYISICTILGIIHCLNILYLKFTKQEYSELVISKLIIIASLVTGLILGVIFSGSSLGSNYPFWAVLLIFTLLTPIILIGVVHFFSVVQLIFWLPVKVIYNVFKKS